MFLFRSGILEWNHLRYSEAVESIQRSDILKLIVVICDEMFHMWQYAILLFRVVIL